MRNLLTFLALTASLTYFSACNPDDAKPDPPTFEDFSIKINLNHTFGGTNLELDKEEYVTANEDTISITRCVYHINKFKFFGEKGMVERPGKYFLVDLEDESSLTLSFDSLEAQAFDSVQFTIGVGDSVDNADGTLNSMFLDPMYWGMINGYINMKLEGRSNSVSSDSVYLLHIGGYMGDYKLSQNVTVSFNSNTLKSQPGSNNLTLNVDLKEYFENPNTIDLGTTNRVHKPNDNAKAISENWPGMFTFGSIK